LKVAQVALAVKAERQDSRDCPMALDQARVAEAVVVAEDLAVRAVRPANPVKVALVAAVLALTEAPVERRGSQDNPVAEDLAAQGALEEDLVVKVEQAVAGLAARVERQGSRANPDRVELVAPEVEDLAAQVVAVVREVETVSEAGRVDAVVEEVDLVAMERPARWEALHSAVRKSL
jgi:hypothetical protein